MHKAENHANARISNRASGDPAPVTCQIRRSSRQTFSGKALDKLVDRGTDVALYIVRPSGPRNMVRARVIGKACLGVSAYGCMMPRSPIGDKLASRKEVQRGPLKAWDLLCKSEC